MIKRARQTAHWFREQYRRGKLSESQIKEVEARLPGWVWVNKQPLKKAHAKIKRTTTRRTIAEWVVEAERLFSEQGKLPTTGELKRMRFSGLSSAMVNYPEQFSHLRSKRVRTPIAALVKAAETLAKNNGGFLPPVSKLFAGGYSSLCTGMYNNPEKFKHIPREKLQKTLQEWLVIARRLAIDNQGTLPTVQWRNDNGYSGLTGAINKNPEMFSEIYRNRKSVEIIPLIAEAEAIAKANGGRLPYLAHLRNTKGYSRLETFIRKHPRAFAHIPRTTEHYSQRAA